MPDAAYFDLGFSIDNRYKVVRLLGAGASGTVYLADDVELGRAVAVKVLHHLSVAGWDDEAKQRFFREAHALSQLKHKYINTVHRIGLLPSGLPFLVMEYVEGKPLSQVVEERGSLPCKEAVAIAIQIAEALHHAHLKGIIHRDVKPDNVLIVSNAGQISVRILDFGLSALLHDSDGKRSQLTRSGSILGTPMYVSPEQFRGEQVDCRSDIYSLGCVTFEMVSGHPPFEAPDIAQVMYKHLHEPLPDLTRLDPQAHLPAELQLFLSRATAKDRSVRPSDMEGAADELRALLRVNSQSRFDPARFSEATPARADSGQAFLSRVVQVALYFAAACLLTSAAVAVLAWTRPTEFTNLFGTASEHQHSYVGQASGRLDRMIRDTLAMARVHVDDRDSEFARRYGAPLQSWARGRNARGYFIPVHQVLLRHYILTGQLTKARDELSAIERMPSSWFDDSTTSEQQELKTLLDRALHQAEK